MMTIRMDKEKFISMSIGGNSYQGENNAEKINVIVPKMLNEYDLKTCEVKLCYINADEIGDETVLILTPYSSSEEYYIATIDLTNKFTYISGAIQFWLRIQNDSNNMIAKTNIVSYMIKKHNDIETYFPDMNDLQNRVKQLENNQCQPNQKYTYNIPELKKISVEGQPIAECYASVIGKTSACLFLNIKIGRISHWLDGSNPDEVVYYVKPAQPVECTFVDISAFFKFVGAEVFKCSICMNSGDPEMDGTEFTPEMLKQFSEQMGGLYTVSEFNLESRYSQGGGQLLYAYPVLAYTLQITFETSAEAQTCVDELLHPLVEIFETLNLTMLPIKKTEVHGGINK